jgi:hypothetical protein
MYGDYIMKPAIVLCLVATNAMALDFDTEWSKFEADFAKFKPTKVAKFQPPVPTELTQVDPKSPERLGLKLSDPAMREKVTALYKKPDTVVYSLTLE